MKRVANGVVLDGPGAAGERFPAAAVCTGLRHKVRSELRLAVQAS